MNWRSLRHFSSLLLMVQKSSDHQLRLVAYPNIYRALYIPSGAKFLPSTVGVTFDLNKKTQSLPSSTSEKGHQNDDRKKKNLVSWEMPEFWPEKMGISQNLKSQIF